MNNIRVATSQFPVSLDIARNAKYMVRLAMKAARAEAVVVHFAETALSGYGRSDFTPMNTGNWQILEDATTKITNLASRLGLWVVFGSCRKVEGKAKPANCVYVVSSDGKVLIYDKQMLTSSELEWCEPGTGNLVVDIQGVRCGFLICYEACFPKLWQSYENDNVRLIFHSTYNISRKPRPLLQELTLAQVRTRATDHGLWISQSTSSSKQSFSTALVARPDGSVSKMPKHTTGILLEDCSIETLGASKHYV
jgi:deaminated glutathione amidase